MLAKRIGVRRPVLSFSLSILALIGSGCASTPQPAPPVAEQPVAETMPVVEAPQPAPAVEVALRPSAPQEYVVKKGDTLWDIASTFLRDPWYWPEIWHVNPQIANPHLIYPGDVITLFYIGGRPYLGVNGGPRVEAGAAAPAGLPTERLSPQVRVEALDRGLTEVPVQAIRQFIVRPRVVTEEVLKRAPYIVDSQDRRLIYGAGDQVYVRGLQRSEEALRFSVFRPGKQLRDPKTNELLGYEAVHVGDATVVALGETSTVVLTDTVREALRGDRLLPIEEDFDRNFIPHAPETDARGSVISLFDAISQIGQNQVAVINLGARDGMEKGHVLSILQAGRTVRDSFGRAQEKLVLPEERTGLMMVFRTFDKVSYALIMESTRPIEVGDAVERP